jgi:hypothetical protein
MESIGEFCARFKRVLVVENDRPAGGPSHGELLGVSAKESTDAVDARADAGMMSDIKARLVLEAWISGRGFLY